MFNLTKGDKFISLTDIPAICSCLTTYGVLCRLNGVGPDTVFTISRIDGNDDVCVCLETDADQLIKREYFRSEYMRRWALGGSQPARCATTNGVEILPDQIWEYINHRRYRVTSVGHGPTAVVGLVVLGGSEKYTELASSFAGSSWRLLEIKPGMAKLPGGTPIAEHHPYTIKINDLQFRLDALIEASKTPATRRHTCGSTLFIGFRRPDRLYVVCQGCDTEMSLEEARDRYGWKGKF